MRQSKTVVMQVTLNGETQYMTPEAYSEFRLTLSTGDFHVHRARKLKRLPKSVPSYMVRDAVYFNPRLKYPTVDSIIEAYSNEDTSAEEYSESEESPLADYVSSFFYGEIRLSQILESCRLTDETIDLLKRCASVSGESQVMSVLKDLAELELVGIYYQDGELFGAHIGEQEYQVDETLAEAFETLTPEEKETVHKQTSAGLYSHGDGRFIYTCNDYKRWVMVVDEEKLARKLKRLLKNSKKQLQLVKTHLTKVTGE